MVSICCTERPVDENCRGNIRLEAATGENFSDEVDIPKPDGMAERSLQFVRWLAEKNPQGKWDYFLSEDVWRYLYTHPVEKVGEPTPMDPGCLKDQPQ